MRSGKRGQDAASLRQLAAQIGLDALARLTPRPSQASPRARIGVFLLWGIGDAVLATPFLRALRQAHGQARIEAIGKPWLAELFAGEDLFDGYARLVPPWTKHTGKYRVWAAEWRRFASAIRALRGSRYDLLVGLRPDPRETLLARVLKAGEFAGYAGEGGRAWVSVDVGVDGKAGRFERTPRQEPGLYRGELAARAAESLMGSRPDPTPRLAPAPPPRQLLQQLTASGYTGGPVLALAFGAAEPTRRWSGERIAETLGRLGRRPGAILAIDSDDSPLYPLPAGVPAVRWRGSLGELKRALALADVVFSTDSGAMHVAAALGCRVVALFGPGSLARFAPRAPNAVYAIEPMPCRPCSDYCIYDRPRCMDEVDPARIAPLVDAALASVERPRAAGFARAREGVGG